MPYPRHYNRLGVFYVTIKGSNQHMNRALILGILLLPVVSFAQTGLDTKSKKATALYVEADNFRVRGQYAEAINALTEAIKKDKKFTEAYYRLGIVYRSMKDNQRAINNFKYALTLTEDIRKKKMIWFDLGDAYMVSGQYKDAIAVLSEFVNAETQNKQRIGKANGWIQNAQFAIDNQGVKGQYKPKPLSDTVNCFALQYFPTLTADQQELIFTRRRGFNRDDDEDMVISRKDAEGQMDATAIHLGKYQYPSKRRHMHDFSRWPKADFYILSKRV